MLAGEVSKILEPFKQEITAMFDDFKANIRNFIKGEIIVFKNEYKTSQTFIKEAVATEVAHRFRFMTSTYEEHQKSLEEDDKREKRKQTLKDMQET